MSFEKAIESLNKIRKSSKYAFLSAIVVGIIAHGYVFANKLPNSDDIISIRAYGGGLSHGCWLKGILGPVISKFAGNYSTPWMIGMVSLLLLAASAVVVSEIFAIEEITGGIIIGGVVTCFPSITGNFLFMYMAMYFSLSIFMSALAVYFIVFGKKFIWQIGGILLIAFSMGIYQAYFPFVAGLLLCDLIRRCFCGQDHIKVIWRDAIKYLVCLAAGIIMYFVLEYLFLWLFGASLTTHKGMNEMGHIDLQMVPGIIVQMYRNMILMLYSDYKGMSSDLMMRILIGISYVSVILFIVTRGIKLMKKKEYLKIVLGVFFIIIFPVTINLIDIMCANSGGRSIYILMEYALSLIFILPIVLMDSLNKPLLHWGVLFCGIGIIFCYANVANAAYLYVDLAQRAIESYYTVMISEIRGTEGYRSDLDIVFVGDIDDVTIYPLKQEFSNIEVSSMEDVTYRVNWYREEFLKYYCGFTSEYRENFKEEYEDVVALMPCYPDYGSIKVFEDQIVVKLSD